MRLRTLILTVLMLAFLATRCTAQPAVNQPAIGTAGAEAPTPTATKPVHLNIFAAASLTEPFNEIGEVFEADHPGVTVVFNFANSQQLAQQIHGGAPADVFASANESQMNAAVEAGGIAQGAQQIFANNQLVVIYRQDNPAGMKELNDLAEPGLKLVLATKEAPVGSYSLEFLEKAAADPAFGPTFRDNVLRNVVSYEENVKAVLTKVALGEADAGIVYTSDVSGQEAAKVGRLDIPDTLNVMAAYPIAPVKDSRNPDLAQEFIGLVLSQDGQDILMKYNFIPIR